MPFKIFKKIFSSVSTDKIYLDKKIKITFNFIFQDDPDAHSVFIKLTRAYEVLKDPGLRKTYDMYGEEKVGASKTAHYHSYSYYKDVFGIYDDDPEIITLNKADFGKYFLKITSFLALVPSL